jgi:hypothetical protein
VVRNTLTHEVSSTAPASPNLPCNKGP